MATRRKLQKLFALLLVLSMTMGMLSVTALAEEPADPGESKAVHGMMICPECGGTKEVTVDCETCGGDGKLEEPCTAADCEDGKVKCQSCGGSGTVGGEECTACEGGQTDCQTCGGDGKLEEPCTAEGCEGGKVT